MCKQYDWQCGQVQVNLNINYENELMIFLSFNNDNEWAVPQKMKPTVHPTQDQVDKSVYFFKINIRLALIIIGWWNSCVGWLTNWFNFALHRRVYSTAYSVLSECLWTNFTGDSSGIWTHHLLLTSADVLNLSTTELSIINKHFYSAICTGLKTLYKNSTKFKS